MRDGLWAQTPLPASRSVVELLAQQLDLSVAGCKLPLKELARQRMLPLLLGQQLQLLRLGQCGRRFAVEGRA